MVIGWRSCIPKTQCQGDLNQQQHLLDRSLLEGFKNRFIIFLGGTGEGNYLTDIVKFNKDSKTWEVINNLEKGRMGHAVSLYPLKQIEQHCL